MQVKSNIITASADISDTLTSKPKSVGLETKRILYVYVCMYNHNTNLK